jgi:hypothetical protein
MTTRAAFLEESRMKLISATEPYRKSGGSGGICSSLNQHPMLDGSSAPTLCHPDRTPEFLRRCATNDHACGFP